MSAAGRGPEVRPEQGRRDVDDFVLEVEALEKGFRRPPRMGRGAKTVRAVRGVSFALRRGECLGLVGESGSGKSTLARCLTGLESPDAGRILLGGEELASLPPSELRSRRRRIQLVFQDSVAALDPRMTVAQSLGEALRAAGETSAGRRAERTVELLGRVGLEPAHAGRFPHQLSGGQRQRVAISRALAVEPEILILDEPVSALDAIVRQRILGLLADLRRRYHLTLLFIGHDLGVVGRISDRVAVMLAGRIVEIGPAALLFTDPRHPYTRALLDAVPRIDVDLSGGGRSGAEQPPPSPETVSPGHGPSTAGLSVAGPGAVGAGTPAGFPEAGCGHAGACPRVEARCRKERPDLRPVGASGWRVACHLADLDGRENRAPGGATEVPESW